RWLVATLLAMPLLLAGCSSFRTEMGQPLPAESSFASGHTRAVEVIHELGPPNRVSRLTDGFAFFYEHSLMTEFQRGIGLNLPVARWFKFVKAWNHLDQQSLLLTFDHQGVLKSSGSGKIEDSLGGGTGVQFLFMVMSFSDVSKFLKPADAHGWGEILLQPPPVALNSAQSLTSGEHGLEMSIAPDFAGQHTMEMIQPKTDREKKKIKKDYQNNQ